MIPSFSLPPSPAKIPPFSFRPSNPPGQKPSRSSSSSPSIKPINNPELLKDRLIEQLDAGRLRKAVSALELSTRQGAHPDLITYSLLLKSCIRARDFQLGKLVHVHLTRSGLELDSVICNSLISLYSKCGDWVRANAIFRSMGKKRDLVSWSAMISCFANNGMEFEAIVTFLDLLKTEFEPNEYCFAAVIRACSNVDYVFIGRIIFGFLIKSCYFESDVCVGCALIDMFVKGSHDLDSACKVFDKMPERNVVTWTLMITRFTQLGYPLDAIDFFLDMISSGYIPDKFTLSGVVSACAEVESFSLGQQLHSWIIRSGLNSDVCVACSLIDMYAKCVRDGSMDDSRKVFDRMLDHNVMSWTAIITGYVQSGRHDKEAIELFHRMIHGCILPNHFTFASVLKACGNLLDPRIGKQVYSHAIKLGLAADTCVGNSLVSMYARCERLEDARKAFDSVFEKNLVSYNTIVDAYSKNLNPKKAFEFFHEIVDKKMGVSAFVFGSLLSGAASIGALNKGEQIHAQVLKSGFRSNQQICNALVDMYSKCGDIEAASKVFNKMEDRNVISWTSMITGYAKHGYAERALETFNNMIELRVKPNEITYIPVLSACSHVGLVSEGWKHFNSMCKDHGISPRTEHYACMVDLLGRSGSLTEAFEFINSMPFPADTLIWRTFLGACRVHGEIELGKLAANMILEKDKHDPAAYILLSNLYASLGQWDKVADTRKTMKESNLIKEAGYSWIEVENKVHKFYVGDTSHPQALEIYDELDKLALKIKRLGYVPDTKFVLHEELEEEQKEKFLFQHSEKIAVAFGLINTAKLKPIRVFKNLRVCGDCHNAIKYISVAYRREIIIRDSNRFHHFRDGRCSCNDYW